MRGQLIRLRKRGCKGVIFFEIVVLEAKQRARGKFTERLGYLSLNKGERCFVLNIPRLGFWLNQGAQLHSSVEKYLIKFI
jgi:ribosomal protein S16